MLFCGLTQTRRPVWALVFRNLIPSKAPFVCVLMNYSFEGFLAALAASARNVPHHMLSLVSRNIRLFFGQMAQDLNCAKAAAAQTVRRNRGNHQLPHS